MIAETESRQNTNNAGDRRIQVAEVACSDSNSILTSVTIATQEDQEDESA